MRETGSEIKGVTYGKKVLPANSCASSIRASASIIPTKVPLGALIERLKGLCPKTLFTAALPPDVRRGYASPEANPRIRGLRPWFGLCPIRPKALPET
jgi:hypothetical protein